MIDIKDVFKKHLPNIKFDKKLFKQLQRFRLGWGQKSDEYIEFLGGVLLGVNVVRFSSLDDEMLMVDILNIDMKELKSDLKNLDGIDPNWKIATNPVYMTIMYLIHGYITKGELGKHNIDAMKELYYIFSYKVMSSLIYNSFKYPADKNVAIATYEKLSNRYIIKRVNNWQEAFEYRSKDVTDSKSKNYEYLKRFTTNDAVLAVNSLQSSHRETFKNIYRVMLEVINNNETIKTTTLITSDEDGEALKDLTERPDKYIVYLNSIIDNESDFIKDTLIDYILSIFAKADKNKIIIALRKISNDSTFNKELTSIIIPTILKYLNRKNVTTDDLYGTIIVIKNFLTTNIVIDKDIEKIKKKLHIFVKKELKINTRWVRTNIINIVIGYIFLRALVKID